ncbi:MAG: hypothetical protein RLN72_08780 [Henriciella sp.]
MKTLLPLAILGLAACTQPKSAEAPQLPGADATAEAVMEADRAFNEMARAQGEQAAFMEYMDQVDGKLFRPGNIVQGRDGIEADFADWPDDADLIWSPLGAHGAASGDLGVTWGEYRVERGGDKIGGGHYVTAWRKNSDGDWKGVIDLGVSEPPPPAEAEQTDTTE